MITGKALHVARWEFIERVKTKSFIIGLFLTPGIMSLFFIAPMLLRDTIAKKDPIRLALYDGTGILADSVRTTLDRSFRIESGPALYDIHMLPTEAPLPRAEAAVDTLILMERIDAAILIPRNALDSLDVEYRARNVADIENISGLERAISEVITSHKLVKAGLDPRRVRELNRHANLRTVRISTEGEKESGFLESFGISYVFLLMLLIMILGSGQMLVRSMVEEKSNRIVEVLVSSCSPMDLMFGKIIGLSLLGLTQVLFWSAISVVLVITSGVTNLPLENLGLMIVYFLLGFLLYAATFVALGCIASTEQEAQQMTAYLSILLSLPLAISMVAIQNPDSGLLVGLSFFPPTTSTIMILRLPIITPPFWQIALSLGLLVASIAGMIWTAAKIFRVGILLTGKRPGLSEIIRWIRS
ncbi:MAG: ABC transporter permease [Ignavibacteriae bacterium]|nr:ABC transporter permease [Ignavibacteriota bacterium]